MYLSLVLEVSAFAALKRILKLPCFVHSLASFIRSPSSPRISSPECFSWRRLSLSHCWSRSTTSENAIFVDLSPDLVYTHGGDLDRHRNRIRMFSVQSHRLGRLTRLIPEVYKQYTAVLVCLLVCDEKLMR